MKVTTDYREFFDRTGIILFPVRLRELGILTNDVSGTFFSEDVDELLDFCSSNPRFHVVTYLGEGFYLNRYDVRGFLFKLAEGESDPSYVLDARPFIRSVFPFDDI